MAEKKKTAQFIPMTSTQAAIGGGVLIGFFALWFLWAAVGDGFISWIGGKNNLSGWVQAIGSILAILVTANIARRDGLHRRTEQAAQRKDRIRKIRVHLARNNFWSSVEKYIFILERNRDIHESPAIKKYKLKNLFVLNQTIRGFDELYDIFSKLDEEEKYFLQLSELGDEFSKIFHYIKLLSYGYEIFYQMADESLEYDKKIGFMRVVKKNEMEDLNNLEKELNKIITSFDEDFLCLKEAYTSISKEIS